MKPHTNENYSGLDLHQARSLAEVFGRFDIKEVVLLLLFIQSRSKWDVNKKMAEFPKAYRVPESSLYKAVDHLEANGFLQVVAGSGRRGRGGMTVNDYALTVKGALAAGINTYVLSLDPKTPKILREILDTRETAREFESSPSWPFLVELLKWHKDRRIDLSHANVDMAYIGTTLGLAILERPELITLESLRALASKMTGFGISAPEIDSKQVDELRDSVGMIQSFGKNLPLLFAKMIRAKREDDKREKK